MVPNEKGNEMTVRQHTMSYTLRLVRALALGSGLGLALAFVHALITL